MLAFPAPSGLGRVHFGFDGFYYFTPDDMPYEGLRDSLSPPPDIDIDGEVYLRPADCPAMATTWYHGAGSGPGFVPSLEYIPLDDGEGKFGLATLEGFVIQLDYPLVAFGGVTEGAGCRIFMNAPAGAVSRLVMFDTDGFAVDDANAELFPTHFLRGECPTIYGDWVVPPEGEGRYFEPWKMVSES